MTNHHLSDRHSIEGCLLSAENEKDQRILTALKSSGVSGTTHHLVLVIPDQFEDFYTVLIDAREVVSFELPRSDPALPAEMHRASVKSYRDSLGQGKSRIRFDAILEAAKLDNA